jgi:hypothetical protein
MQFRPPFRPLPSDQSWQPDEFPTQHQVDLQQQQQLSSPQFQPPLIMRAQSSEKKSRKRLCSVIAVVGVVVVLALATVVILPIVNNSSTEDLHTKAVPTQEERLSSQITPVGTTTTAAENLQNVKPTHGTPALYRQISDFIGTYGKPSTTNGKDSMWLLNMDGSLSLEARNTGRGVVGYLSISIPNSWSMQKAKSYCLTFAPHNYTLVQTSNPDNSGNLFVYNSPSGRFALHISSGYPLYCYMDNVSNP